MLGEFDRPALARMERKIERPIGRDELPVDSSFAAPVGSHQLLLGGHGRVLRADIERDHVGIDMNSRQLDVMLRPASLDGAGIVIGPAIAGRDLRAADRLSSRMPAGCERDRKGKEQSHGLVLQAAAFGERRSGSFSSATGRTDRIASRSAASFRSLVIFSPKTSLT